MGTRSTVKFFDGDNIKPILSVYQQYDGYPSGVGQEVYDFLKKAKIINGFNDSQKMADGYANGIGCLAAQFVAEHKIEIGGFYITNSRDKQEYNYEIRFVNGKFKITVDNEFDGDLEAFAEYVKD